MLERARSLHRQTALLTAQCKFICASDESYRERLSGFVLRFKLNEQANETSGNGIIRSVINAKPMKGNKDSCVKADVLCSLVNEQESR